MEHQFLDMESPYQNLLSVTAPSPAKSASLFQHEVKSRRQKSLSKKAKAAEPSKKKHDAVKNFRKKKFKSAIKELNVLENYRSEMDLVAKNELDDTAFSFPVINQNGILEGPGIKRVDMEVESQEAAPNDGKKVTPDDIVYLTDKELVIKSSLIRLYLKETLTEIKISDNAKRNVTVWLDKLKQFIMNINDCDQIEISQDTEIPNVVFPMKINEKHGTLKFKFNPPKSVTIIGSFNIDCVIKQVGVIDLAVETPKGTFGKGDHLNERYLIKRNYYLCCVASKLLGHADNALRIASVEFQTYPNPDKLTLLVRPMDKSLHWFSVRIHVVCSNDMLKESRLSPAVNNMRYDWYFDKKTDGKFNTPTPFYNSLIGQDSVTLANEQLKIQTFNSWETLKDVLMLLKVWLSQLKLNNGLGSFSNYLLSMYLIYLVKIGKINRNQSCFCILKNVWTELAQSSWDISGISLYDGNQESKHSITNMYDILFLDVTGQVNLASCLDVTIYYQVKHQAGISNKMLTDQTKDSFLATFMTPVSITQQFDHILCFENTDLMKTVVEKHVEEKERLDFRGNYMYQFVRLIIKTLRDNENRRISQMCYYTEPSILEWPANSIRPELSRVLIGLKINPEQGYSVIDQGPSCDDESVNDYLKFWSPHSQTRHYKDGSSKAVVCWGQSDDPLKKKRSTTKRLIEFLLGKLGISNEHYLDISEQVETLIFENYVNVFKIRGIEEASLNVTDSYDSLANELHRLDGLPLPIISVHGTSPVLNHTEPFVPIKSSYAFGNNSSLVKVEDRLSFKEFSPNQVPVLVKPINVVIELSSSGKWPTELNAIRCMKTAFCKKVGELLKQKHGYKFIVNEAYVDVLKDEYVFRITVYYAGELGALMRQTTKSGLVYYVDNPESLSLKKEFMHRSILCSTIRGLRSMPDCHPMGVTAVLAKRWLRSQLIDEHNFPDICVDLLVCYLYLFSEPYATAFQPQAAFLRFLKILATKDWIADPIIVNFNRQMSGDDICTLTAAFNKNRAMLPPLVIITPLDTEGTMWTKNAPTVMILSRVRILAQASIDHLDRLNSSYDYFNDPTELKTLFRPELNCFQILIWLHLSKSPLRWLNIDVRATAPIKQHTKYNKVFPILNFNPVEKYIEDLRHYFGKICEFFFDTYGGNVIGVLIRPGIENEKSTQLLIGPDVKHSQKSNIRTSLIERLIEEFSIVGKDIVLRIEKHSG